MTPINGWEKTSLGAIATLVKGISYASEDYCVPGQGAIFLTIKCVSKAGGFKPEGIKYFKGKIPYLQELHAGDLLIANTDLTRAGDIVGAPIVVPSFNGETVTMSMDLSKVVEDKRKIDRQFLYFILMTDSVRRFMKDHASGSTVLHLQTRAVPTLEICIPTKKPEQTKIAEILSTVDQAIDQTEALIAKQQRIKTGLMQDLLTRGIDKDGNLRSENTWPIRKLRDIADIRVSNVDKKVYTTETPVRLCNYMDVYVNDYITSEIDFMHASASTTEIQRFSLQPGDVIITKDSETPDDIGVPAVVSDEIEHLVCGYHLCLIRPNTGDLNSIYLAKQLATSKIAQYFAIHASGSTRFGLPIDAIENMALPFPPRSEQTMIAEILSAVDQAIDQTEALKVKLQHFKTSLMQDLLTGKVFVTSLLTETEASS